MASGTAQLVVKVVSDVSSATKGLDQVSSRADKMKRGLGTAAKVSGAALLGLGAAAISAGNAAAEDASQQALLAKAMQNATGATADQIAATEDWIDKTSRAVGVADDKLRPALGTLVRATGSVEESQRALNVALDVSAATGKDVESVSAALAKGYAGNTSALSRLVPGIDAAAVASGDMDKVMASLAATTGGAAAVAADTAAGKMALMKIQMDEAQETLGAILLPLMVKFATILTKVAGFVERNSKAVQILVGVLAALAVIIIATNAALKAYRAAVVIATAAQWLWNVALSANPIGLTIIAVLALVAALVILWKKSETFRDKVTAAWEAVKTATQTVADFITDKWTDTWDAITSAASTVGAALSAPFDAARAAIDWLIGKIQELISWLGKIHVPDINIPGAGALGGLDLTPWSAAPAPAPSAMALGRLAPTTTSSSSGAGVNITVNGALDPEAVARQIRRILAGHDRRVGLTP